MGRRRRYIYCPNCGAQNEMGNNFCAMCGASLKSVANRVLAAHPPQPPTPTLPPNVQQTLSPALLIYLFRGHYFKEEMTQTEMVDFMVAATLYALEAEGHIALRLSRRGRVRKRETVEIRKLRDFDTRRFGSLSERIGRLGVGKSINVYDLVKKTGVKCPNPAYYFIEVLVPQRDPTRETFNFLFEVKEKKPSLLDRLLEVDSGYKMLKWRKENIKLYEPQARQLDQLLRQRMNTDPRMHRVIVEECHRALEDLEG